MCENEKECTRLKIKIRKMCTRICHKIDLYIEGLQMQGWKIQNKKTLEDVFGRRHKVQLMGYLFQVNPTH